MFSLVLIAFSCHPYSRLPILFERVFLSKFVYFNTCSDMTSPCTVLYRSCKYLLYCTYVFVYPCRPTHVDVHPYGPNFVCSDMISPCTVLYRSCKYLLYCTYVFVYPCRPACVNVHPCGPIFVWTIISLCVCPCVRRATIDHPINGLEWLSHL